MASSLAQVSRQCSTTTVPSSLSYRYNRTHYIHSTHCIPRSRTIPRANLFDKFFENVSKQLNNISEQEQEEDVSAGAPHEGSFLKLDPESTSSLDGSGESTFGPLAMLAVGLLAQEFTALENLMSELGAEEVAIVPCTGDMLNGTLGDALSSIDSIPEHEDPVLGTRRVVFLSGMYASEVIDVVGAVREADELPDMAFAAAVPKSWNRNLKELVLDVYADHAAMAKRRAQMALEAAKAQAAFDDSDSAPTEDSS